MSTSSYAGLDADFLFSGGDAAKLQLVWRGQWFAPPVYAGAEA
jgi:hypothetical protein